MRFYIIRLDSSISSSEISTIPQRKFPILTKIYIFHRYGNFLTKENRKKFCHLIRAQRAYLQMQEKLRSLVFLMRNAKEKKRKRRERDRYIIRQQRIGIRQLRDYGREALTESEKLSRNVRRCCRLQFRIVMRAYIRNSQADLSCRCRRRRHDDFTRERERAEETCPFHLFSFFIFFYFSVFLLSFPFIFFFLLHRIMARIDDKRLNRYIYILLQYNYIIFDREQDPPRFNDETNFPLQVI